MQNFPEFHSQPFNWFMKSSTLSVSLLLWLSVFPAPLSSAANGGTQPADIGPQARFSPDDFDWRQMVPYLFAAAALPSEQGIQSVFENSTVLRVHVANQISPECRRDKGGSDAQREGCRMEREVDKRNDGIVREGMVHGRRPA